MELDIHKLSPEQRAAFEKQLKEAKKAEKEKQKQDIAALVAMECEIVMKLFDMARPLSSRMVAFKKECIDLLMPLIRMKIDFKKAAEDQESYSFFSEDKSMTIRIRFNTTSRFSDEIQFAIESVKQWLADQITDDKTQRLVKLMEKFIVRDKKGNYSAGKLMIFSQQAKEMDEPLLTEAAEAMERSIYETATTISVDFTFKDDLGAERRLPLSTTKA